jgi:hypothetical protein
MKGGRILGGRSVSHPKANRVLEVLAAVIDSLKGARVSYMMIGAWALSVWGRPRATMDLDFLVMVDGKGLGRLERHLIQEGFSSVETWLEWNPMLKDLQRRMQFEGIAVDLMCPRDIHDNQAFERRKRKRSHPAETESGASPGLRGCPLSAGTIQEDAGFRIPETLVWTTRIGSGTGLRPGGMNTAKAPWVKMHEASP